MDKLIKLAHERANEIILDNWPEMLKIGDKEINATTILIDDWVMRIQLKREKIKFHKEV